ncbi:MAG: hypothetical protein AB7V13_18335 [Pseudorhodoplanes sp.]
MEATKRRAQKLEAKGQVVDFKQLLPLTRFAGTWTLWSGRKNCAHRCSG